MTAVYSPQAPTPERGASDAVTADVTVGAFVAVVLAVAGLLAGLLWAAWSPPGPRALVLGHGSFIPDETESFVAGDGRYLVIVSALGLLAALAVWFRRESRGVPVLIGLVVGGLAGALLTEWLGHLTGGGTFSGKTDTIIGELPLSLHAQGLLFVEPAVAALVYGLLVAFAAHDDLGRPDPVRDALAPPPPGPYVAGPDPYSVGPGAHPQYGWGHGDAPGALQQRDLPPQQPGQPDQPL